VKLVQDHVIEVDEREQRSVVETFAELEFLGHGVEVRKRARFAIRIIASFPPGLGQTVAKKAEVVGGSGLILKSNGKKRPKLASCAKSMAAV
jgi:hypothetical protein